MPAKAKRRWGHFALPVLHDDRLVGKVDATADRESLKLRVRAIHQDVRFTRAITTLPAPRGSPRQVRRRDRLGGLLNEYELAA